MTSINNNLNPLGPGNPKPKEGVKGSATSADKAPQGSAPSLTNEGTSGEQVLLSSAGKSIQRLSEDVSNEPETSRSKVELIKAQLANDSYQIDSEKVAAKFLQFESKL